MWFNPTVDGYLLPEDPFALYAAGQQAQAPLLAGVNSQESDYKAVLGNAEPTVANYRAALERLYPGQGERLFEVYGAATEDEVMDAAMALAGDRFISQSTWRWIDRVTKTGAQKTFYYLYARPRPVMRAEMGNLIAGLAGGVMKNPDPQAKPQPQSRGAVHSAEIEYALGNLGYNERVCLDGGRS